MTICKRNVLFLALSAALASFAGAQSVTVKSGERDQTFGLSQTNVQFYEGGEIRRENMRRSWATSKPSRMRYDADGFILVHTHVYGFKFTAFSARADGHLVEGYGNHGASNYVAGTPRYSSARGHIRLKVGGYVFYERTRNASGYIGAASYSRNVIDASKTFYPGGIPVTVGLTGGATLTLGAGTNLIVSPAANRFYASQSSLELNANGSGYCSATASAGVGWSGFGAGVEFELRFLNAALSMGANGSRTGISGVVRMVVQPLRIFLNAYAEAGTRWTINIYNWSIGNSFTWSRTFW